MRGLFSGSVWLGNAKLPHPPIMEGMIEIIENAIRAAWKQVIETIDLNGIKTEDAYEDQITEALCKYLEGIRLKSSSGFCPDQFESVQRESNWRDYQNFSIDKQPDLVFKFFGKRPGVDFDSAYYDGLFIECKPIDSKHPIQGHYLDKGLSRFVDGTYAWAMQNAMMLGYTNHGNNLNSKLIPVLSKSSVQESLKMCDPPSPCINDTVIFDRCETRHTRDWIYQHNGEKAGFIRIRHLWLGYQRTP
ncbi:hypothetical protein ACH518_10490 [Methylomonas sp. HW2-6]|uniref:hypothetical protein n=1 Tax=Methylomonas sp. HW2-6 TaxID=3376687 RepID=UPI0040411CEF